MSKSSHESKKYHRLLSFASEQGINSPMQHKHGAVIYHGKRLICGGYNTNQRNKYMGNFLCSIHAEIDVLVKFFNSYIKIHTIRSNPCKIRRKLSKYSMSVVRIHESDNNVLTYQNSSPCKDCVEKLKTSGLNKLSFSINHNEIYTGKIKNLDGDDYRYSKSLRCENIREQIRHCSFFR